MVRRTKTILVSADGAARVDAAHTWLTALPPDAEALVLGASWEAADDLVRDVVVAGGARFGLVRLTLDRLATRLALRALVSRGLTPTTGLSLVAVVARTVHLLLADGRLAYFEPVARMPGFAGAMARTLGELRMNALAPAAVGAVGRGGADVAVMADAVASELAAAGLADRAAVYEAALAVAAGGAEPLLDLPLLLLDVPLASRHEEELVARLAARVPEVFATAPHGDERGIARLERALGVSATRDTTTRAVSLGSLAAHLFEDVAPPARARDATVVLAAWPDEARECTEIARAVQAAARDEGVPFDRMAVALHAPAEYTAHLEEAFARAAIPYFAAAGARRPHPAGRALLALLDCAADGLSARRFAEYLSLGQVPDPGARPDAGRWVAPENDLLPDPGLDAPFAPPPDPVLHPDPRGAAVVDGTLRAPSRWEELLVEASVIGKVARWRERLDGFARELERRAAEAGDDDDARQAAIRTQRADLVHLREFALPVVEELDRLPKHASWKKWIDVLKALALRTLREPDLVLRTLDELAPMGPIGGVDLDEVRLVLGPRLRDLTQRPPRRRYGCVFVAPAHALRGMSFDVVFVPGLAENVFPTKLVEDP